MTPASSAKLTLILAVVAAMLALGAALIRYQADGEIRWSLVAAAIFILAFGLGAKARMRPKE
jgi:predicted membrane-bound dolichyl-phosphate-mannose-protein mannosyltransferase